MRIIEMRIMFTLRYADVAGDDTKLLKVAIAKWQDL